MFKNLNILYAARLWRTRAVVRYGRFIFDGANLNAFTGKSAQHRLAAGADAAHDNRRFLQADHQSLFSEKLADLRRRIRRRLACAREAKRAGARTYNGIPFFVGKDGFGIVKGRLNMQDALLDMAFRNFRKGAFLPPLVEASPTFLDDAFFTHGEIFKCLKI